MHSAQQENTFKHSKRSQINSWDRAREQWRREGEGVVSMTTTLTKDSPDKTSSKEIRLCPSRRSSYRSFTCFRTWGRERERERENKRGELVHKDCERQEM